MGHLSNELLGCHVLQEPVVLHRRAQHPGTHVYTTQQGDLLHVREYQLELRTIFFYIPTLRVSTRPPHANITLQPSAHERTSVSCCRSDPGSSHISPGGSSILGKAWIILATPYDASMSAKSSTRKYQPLPTISRKRSASYSPDKLAGPR